MINRIYAMGVLTLFALAWLLILGMFNELLVNTLIWLGV